MQSGAAARRGASRSTDQLPRGRRTHRTCLAGEATRSMPSPAQAMEEINLPGTGALFSFQKILQNFSDFPSHRIFRRMYGVLNINENKN